MEIIQNQLTPSQVLDEEQKVILNIYKENNIRSLRGIIVPKEKLYELNGKNILTWFPDPLNPLIGQYSKYCESKDVELPEGYEQPQAFNILDDFFAISDELAFFTAKLFQHTPHLSNPINEAFPFYDRIIYPHFERLDDVRHSIYGNACFQSCYSFWDRVGDTLSLYFPRHFKPGSPIYFGRTIDFLVTDKNIPDSIKNSPHLLWLKTFWSGEFKNLNSKRNDVVHHSTLRSRFIVDYLKISGELDGELKKEKMEKLQLEREELGEYFLKQIDLTLQGFEHSVELMNELRNELL
jgi:hypothetical protein